MRGEGIHGPRWILRMSGRGGDLTAEDTDVVSESQAQMEDS